MLMELASIMEANPAASCAFVVQPGDHGSVSFRFETRGSNKDLKLQINNGAELRAVIAALKYRAWGGESFGRLIIATNSEYVVNGATQVRPSL